MESERVLTKQERIAELARIHPEVSFTSLAHHMDIEWYTVNQGATTMWERWNSYTLEDGFGPVEMNSFNHYVYGSVGDWMYATVAGLRVDLREPDEAPIRIEPHPGHGLTSAAASLSTPFGPASSSWKMDGDTVTLTIEVPANASARVSLAAAEVDARPVEGSADSPALVSSWPRCRRQDRIRNRFGALRVHVSLCSARMMSTGTAADSLRGVHLNQSRTTRPGRGVSHARSLQCGPPSAARRVRSIYGWIAFFVSVSFLVGLTIRVH